MTLIELYERKNNFEDFDNYTQNELLKALPLLTTIKNEINAIFISLKSSKNNIRKIDRFLKIYSSTSAILSDPNGFIISVDDIIDDLKYVIDKNHIKNLTYEFNKIKKQLKNKNLNTLKRSSKAIENSIDKLIDSFE